MAQTDITVEVDASALQSATLHEICAEAVRKMIDEGITRHISYISAEDNLPFDIPFNVRVPKVTIEWVDPAETEPHQDAGSE